MKSTMAKLQWNLWVDCPYCGASLDLSDGEYDCEGEFSIPIFNNKWNDLKGREVECVNCLYVFKIDEVEY